jgi:hypothetical protein
MNFKTLIEQLDPEMYQRLKLAVEIGKWGDGRALTQEQRELSLQAIIAYEVENKFPQSERIGFVDTGTSECHDDDGTFKADAEPTLLKWKQ